MTTPLIAFRVDASVQIGNGHVMRCLTLADALRDRGAQCHFVCREHPGNLLALIRDRGHRVTALAVENAFRPQFTGGRPVHAPWLGASWQDDAEATLEALGDGPVQWLVTDHYALDAPWERMLRPACQQLMVIDDIADRPHDCDLLLDQNLGRTEFDYLGITPAHATCLIGPKYALLRPDFARLRSYSLAQRKSTGLQQLLVTMGGVDKDNITGAVLSALADCLGERDDVRVVVVMGPHAPWLQQVRIQAAQMPFPASVLVGVNDMAQLMADSELAIGAAGSTSWERCCLGLPCIQMVLAENQKAIADALAKAGAVITADVESLPRVLADMLADDGKMPLRLKELSEAAIRITDGRGVERVASVLERGMS